MNDLSNLLAGTENRQLIKWPGTDITVSMRILSDHEIQQATFATERIFAEQKMKYDTIFTADSYQQEKVTQMLYMSLSWPDEPGKKVTATITDFRKALTLDAKNMLSDIYVQFEKDRSPQPETMTQDEFDKLFVDIKKKPDDIIGKFLSCNTLKKLIITLASQPEIFPRGNG
jgi:hypothetical protein